jgi:hypothetical protein
VYNYDNWAQAYGAGIFSANSTVLFTNSILEFNTYANTPFYGRGGGACIYGGSWTISHSVVATNIVRGWYDNGCWGGGLFIEGGSHRLENVLFANNCGASYNGYGTYRYYGGGLYVNANLQMDLCTVAGSDGEGIRLAGGALAMTNTIVWGNGIDITNVAALTMAYSDVGTGNAPGGDHCLSVDPAFVDRVHYHLASRTGCYTDGYFTGGRWVRTFSTSPLIDAGDPRSEYRTEPSPNGLRVNMGYDGNTPVASMQGNAATVFMVR